MLDAIIPFALAGSVLILIGIVLACCSFFKNNNQNVLLFVAILLMVGEGLLNWDSGKHFSSCLAYRGETERSLRTGYPHFDPSKN